MAFIPVSRAPALPSAADPVRSGALSLFGSMQAHARTRGDDVAFVVQSGTERDHRTWAQVAHAVERTGAGLVRSGLRPDQVVLSLLPAGHAWPELDLALQAIGAVVVRVSPHAGVADLERELAGVDVRLVVAEDEADLGRLHGLAFRAAEMFSLDGGRGWDRLMALGAERLVMDPDVVARADRVVDPAFGGPRLLRSGTALGRLAPAADQVPALAGDAVVVLVGDPTDAVVQRVREAHLVSGCTLRHVADTDGLAAELEALGPTVLAVSSDAAVDLHGFLGSSPAQAVLRRRPGRARGHEVAALRTWLGGHLEQVIGRELPDRVHRLATEIDVRLHVPSVDRLVAADLPVPPPVVLGDATLLPRRSRQKPGDEFKFDDDRAPVRAEPDLPDASAFSLPSLPLFGGESFLDKLLIARAEAGAS